LLEIGSGKSIEHFMTQDLIDRRLPMSLYKLRTHLRDIPNGEELARKFDQEQWKFCPARFELDMDVDYVEQTILPVCKKDLVGKGGTAEVWKIAIQEEFVSESLKSALEGNWTSVCVDVKYGRCFVFALKTFKEEHAVFFKEEQNAFRALRCESGIIRCFGSYSERGPSETSTNHLTYNLLLECGDMDLDQTFTRRLPPVLPSEINAFWSSMFGISDAINRLHNLKTDSGEYHG